MKHASIWTAAGWLVVLAALAALGGAAPPGGFLGALGGGARPAVLAILVVGGGSLGMGVALGLGAALGPKLLDRTLGRAVDMSAAIPAIVIVALFSANSEGRYWSFVATLAALRTVEIARLTRWESARLAGADHFTAARALGASTYRLGRVHLLPLALRPALTSAVFAAAATAALEAALGYFGLTSNGSWGSTLAVPGARGATVGAMLGIALTTGALYVLGRAAVHRWAPPRPT